MDLDGDGQFTMWFNIFEDRCPYLMLRWVFMVEVKEVFNVEGLMIEVKVLWSPHFFVFFIYESMIIYDK
jgi:hypothetical protein